jgi:hypothetical protein
MNTRTSVVFNIYKRLEYQIHQYEHQKHTTHNYTTQLCVLKIQVTYEMNDDLLFLLNHLRIERFIKGFVPPTQVTHISN